MPRYLFALIVTAAVATPAGAAETRYVSLTGTDWATDCTAVAPCRTLKWAVNQAGENDTIVVGEGLFEEDGTIVIGKPLTIIGAGASLTTIKPLSAVTVFDIGNIKKATYKVAIRSLEIVDGQYGVENGRDLTLEDVVVRHHLGTGIINGNFGSIRLHRVRVFGNQGAAFDNYKGGFAFVTESSFFGNIVSDPAGGVRNAGDLFMHQSAVYENIAPYGGMLNSGGLMYLTNVTISGNTAQGNPGVVGGIMQLEGQSYLTHVTITNNTGSSAGGVYSANFGTVYLRNTIVAGNSSPQCRIHYIGSSLNGDITGAGNLTSDNSCNLWPAGPGGTGSANVMGVDPGLLPLADNGGTTLTHALLPGSLAIDGGYEQYCLKQDQRGIARPVDGDHDAIARCDIGAFEYNFEVGGGSRDGAAYWHYRGQWYRRGPNDHAFRRQPVRRE